MGNPGRIEMGIWIKVFRVQEKGLRKEGRKGSWDTEQRAL